jgi:hypothetical protein
MPRDSSGDAMITSARHRAPHIEISAGPGIPTGTIGPNCGRWREKPRRYRATAARACAEAGSAGGETHGQPVVDG